ncbi:transposase [Streptomyces tsukubensis]|uniref:Insertion element IS402-like domain-containing protein n=1 Tax=Streptomyces tsukubensis TaxID=83656 RepID=A0A1V4A7J4_9ACTN|nr:transposase [Streptomyces tsukubensis]OON77956.1 hypothetical protein B1H18_17110 [Streptomyces tsukubensis]
MSRHFTGHGPGPGPRRIPPRAARTGPGAAAGVHDLRDIVNAFLYGDRSGIAWEYPPHDFPPSNTVYDSYAQWEADGVAERVPFEAAGCDGVLLDAPKRW